MTYTSAVIAAFVFRARLQGLAFLVGAAGSFGAVFVFAGCCCSPVRGRQKLGDIVNDGSEG